MAGIVEPFDVTEQIMPGVSAGCVDTMMHPLGLERVEETLHRSIVQAIALAAHGRGYAGSCEHQTVGFSCVLNAAIGMVD